MSDLIVFSISKSSLVIITVALIFLLIFTYLCIRSLMIEYKIQVLRETIDSLEGMYNNKEVKSEPKY